MTDTEDEALKAELDADAKALRDDTAAIEAAVKSEAGMKAVAEVADKLFTFFEPVLVGVAAAEGGPFAGAGAKIIGDAVGAKLHEFAKK